MGDISYSNGNGNVNGNGVNGNGNGVNGNGNGNGVNGNGNGKGHPVLNGYRKSCWYEEEIEENLRWSFALNRYIHFQ